MKKAVPDFTVQKDGFHGKLYRSESAEYNGKALVMFSGSDGRFELLVQNPKESAVIPVEHIQGPILLFSGGMDSMWPAKPAAEFIAARLKEKIFSYECQHISYEHGSHYMAPMHLRTEKMFKAERKYKAESSEIKQDQMEKTLEFLKRW